jgi:hypothetical protein
MLAVKPMLRFYEEISKQILSRKVAARRFRHEICFPKKSSRVSSEWKLFHTSVLCKLIRTFLMLPFRSMLGDRLPNPGFWMPKSSVGTLGRGFLRLDLNGPRLVMIVLPVPSVMVDPLETDVIVVVTEPMLPAYGFPDDTVIATPRSETAKPLGILSRFSRTFTHYVLLLDSRGYRR